MKQILSELLVFSLLLVFIFSDPTDELSRSLQSILETRSLMGLQLQLTKDKEIIYHGNFGKRDGVNPVESSTMFRVASLSKSFVSAAIMTLVQVNKLKLTQSISSILGFEIKNPFFPDVPLTVQMLLTHQSSLIQCDPYYSNFLMDTYQAKTGTEIPKLKEILSQGGKYYNQCLFSKSMAPGTHFQYVNLNFGIGGAIIQKISGIRFDIYLQDKILKHISEDMSEQATFNAAYIKNSSNLGAIFVGNQGNWQPSYDYYPDGKIPQRNLEGYEIGSNGVIFGPQGGLRASVTHLSNYMMILASEGLTKNNVRVLSQSSVKQMLKPRYQYHGQQFGSTNDFHLYGFGLYTTTYRPNDIVLQHKVLRGHLGAAYGLISGYYFWDNYTLTYQINGALKGYGYGTGTIYEKERLLIHGAIEDYLRSRIVKISEQ